MKLPWLRSLGCSESLGWEWHTREAKEKRKKRRAHTSGLRGRGRKSRASCNTSPGICVMIMSRCFKRNIIQGAHMLYLEEPESANPHSAWPRVQHILKTLYGKSTAAPASSFTVAQIEFDVFTALLNPELSLKCNLIPGWIVISTLPRYIDNHAHRWCHCVPTHLGGRLYIAAATWNLMTVPRGFRCLWCCDPVNFQEQKFSICQNSREYNVLSMD